MSLFCLSEVMRGIARKSSKASVFGFYSMAKYMGIKCGGVKHNHKMCGRLDKSLSQTLYHFLWLNTPNTLQCP